MGPDSVPLWLAPPRLRRDDEPRRRAVPGGRSHPAPDRRDLARHARPGCATTPRRRSPASAASARPSCSRPGTLAPEPRRPPAAVRCPCDQVPRLQAHAGAGAGRSRGGGGRAHRARPLHRHDPGRAGAEAAGDRGHGERPGDVRRRAQRLLHRQRRDEPSTSDGPRRGAGPPRRAAGPALATSPRRSASAPASSSPATAPASTRSGTPSSVDHPPGDPLRPILLTSLMLAADRVDSTTGVQMAYLKQWAPRAHRDLRLRATGAAARSGRHDPRRREPGRRRGRPGGPGLRRSALQPAPLLHQLPHLGDADPLGRSRALRRRLQARRQPRRRHPQRVQQPPHDARGARPTSSAGCVRRSSSCPTTTSPGSPPTR